MNDSTSKQRIDAHQNVDRIPEDRLKIFNALVGLFLSDRAKVSSEIESAEEMRDVAKLLQRLGAKARRAALSPAEREEKRKADAARMRRRRATFTPEEHDRERQQNASRIRIKRAAVTPSNREEEQKTDVGRIEAQSPNHDKHGLRKEFNRLRDDPEFQAFVKENLWSTRRDRGIPWRKDVFEFIAETYGEDWIKACGMCQSDLLGTDDDLYKALAHRLSTKGAPEDFALPSNAHVSLELISDPDERAYRAKKREQDLVARHKREEVLRELNKGTPPAP